MLNDESKGEFRKTWFCWALGFATIALFLWIICVYSIFDPSYLDFLKDPQLFAIIGKILVLFSALLLLVILVKCIYLQLTNNNFLICFNKPAYKPVEADGNNDDGDDDDDADEGNDDEKHSDGYQTGHPTDNPKPSAPSSAVDPVNQV